jgi:predicted Zn-dependent protease
MFSRLGQVESKMGKTGHDFFQTHPSSESRVKVRHVVFYFTFH